MNCTNTTLSNEKEARNGLSGEGALIYILVVISVYAVAMVALVIQYLWKGKNDASLSDAFQEYVLRQQFMDAQLSARRKSLVLEVRSALSSLSGPDSEPTSPNGDRDEKNETGWNKDSLLKESTTGK